MKKYSRYLFVVAVVILTSCQNKRDSSQHSEPKKTFTCPMHPQIVQDKPGTCPICGMDLVEIKAGGDATEVTLNQSQIALANISVEPISLQSIGSTLLLNGKLKTDETQTEVVSTRVPGRLDKLFFKETGTRVSKGQVIYEIYSEQLLTYQQEYLLALDQVKALGDKPSQSYMEAAKKKLWLYGMTDTQIKELTATKQSSPRIQFVAPASGIVTEIMVAEGQYVSEGSSVYRLENLGNLWAEAELYPNEASLIKVGDPVAIRVMGFENEIIPSKVIFLAPEYREGSQTFVLRAPLGNPEYHFIPGMQIEIVFEYSKKKALVLPNDAVIREEKGTLVYLKNGQGKFKSQMISTGQQNFDKVEITEGLSEGDSVVVSGAYLLYSEVILKKGGNPMVGHHHEGITVQAVSLEQTNATEMGFAVDPKFAQQLRGLLPPYLKLKNALVASDANLASAEVKELATSISHVNMNLLKDDAHMKWIAQLKDMTTATKLLAASHDLEIQRASFSQLSNALHDAIKTFKVENIHAYYQFCPMAFDNKGAFWISAEQEISNPYFGKAMLRCGVTKETLK